MAIERKTRNVVKSLVGSNDEEQQIKGQESIETLEDGKYMPPASEPPKAEKKKVQTDNKPKKKGRPSVNREKKGRYSFTILPSIYEQAQTAAYGNGVNLSELITDFLTDYVSKNS